MAGPQPPVSRLTKLGTLPAAMRSPSDVALDCNAVDELIVGPHRRDGGHFVDDDSWHGGLLPQHRQQSDGRIVGAALFNCGYAALCNHLQDNILAGRLCAAKFKLAITAGFCLSQLLGLSQTLAAHRVTVEFASGPPPAWTWPAMRTSAAAVPHAYPISAFIGTQ